MYIKGWFELDCHGLIEATKNLDQKSVDHLSVSVTAIRTRLEACKDCGADEPTRLAALKHLDDFQTRPSPGKR